MAALPLTLFGHGRTSIVDQLCFDRLILDEWSWIDVARGSVRGADTLFARLEEELDWHTKRRLIFGKWFDEPRLSATSPREGFVLPDSVGVIRAALTRHYKRAFEGLFCNLYRDGRDSVAWHADRIGRTDLDPLVAIVSLGGPRTFALRPFGAGRSRRIVLHSGDILVMGGATQHYWEHSIPKTREASPRMSVTMRAGGPPFGVRVGSESGLKWSRPPNGV